MEYRSIQDLGVTVRRNLWRLPQPVDLVVGVPRSGLLVASLVSLALNVPMADVEGYCAGRLLATGKTKRSRSLDLSTADPGRRRRVVVIDDSIFMGSSMREARARVAAARPQDDVTFVAVYGNGRRHPDADLVLEAVPQPRLFEWNVMHHAMLAETCMEIDGVLCPPPDGTGGRDEAANQAPNEAPPLFLPTRPVRTLVTQRPERDRAATEAWLRRHGVEYGRLVMRPGAGAPAGRDGAPAPGLAAPPGHAGPGGGGEKPGAGATAREAGGPGPADGAAAGTMAGPGGAAGRDRAGASGPAGGARAGNIGDPAPAGTEGPPGRFKGEVYRRDAALLFIEGDHAQALEIVAVSGKPVLCTHCFEMLRGRATDPVVLRQNLRGFARRFALAKTPLTNARAARLMLRQALGEALYGRMKRASGRLLPRR